MKILVKVTAIIVAFVGLSWLIGGGYTAWRLTAVTGRHINWDFQSSFLQQWVQVILWDHLTQILLAAIVAIALFRRISGQRVADKSQMKCRQCRQETEAKAERIRYWQRRLV